MAQDLEGYGMDFSIEAVSTDDGMAIIDIFNHYVENSFAAYPESKVPYEFFGLFLNMAGGFPFLVAKDLDGNVLGFGLLHAHNPMQAFSHVAEITYFIAPDHRGKGIGKSMLDSLLAMAGKRELHLFWPASLRKTSRALLFIRRTDSWCAGVFSIWDVNLVRTSM